MSSPSPVNALNRSFSSFHVDSTASAAASSSSPARRSPLPATGQDLDLSGLFRDFNQSPDRVQTTLNQCLIAAVQAGNLALVTLLFSRDKLAPSPRTVKTATMRASLLKSSSVGDLSDMSPGLLAWSRNMKEIYMFLKPRSHSTPRASTPPPRLL